MSRAALLGVASTVALSSCALPPREAWRKIQDDGLIAYIKYEIDTPSHWSQPRTPTPMAPASPTIATPAKPASSGMVLAQRNFVDSLQGEDTSRALTAFSVPALPGYVRSPYTNPPRLVDVRGASAGTTMVCPYTHRKFIVPGGAIGSAPSTVLAENTPRVQAIEPPAPVVKQQEAPRVTLNDKPTTPPAPSKPIEKKSEAPRTPSVASTTAPSFTTPAPSAPVTTTPTTPAPSTPPALKQPATTPAPSASVVASNPPVKPSAPVVTAPPPAAPKPVQEIPYGESIAGRPGFVNSPYAAKHQLVDVTGLPAGMEVKCPYTGKLFRVPMQDMASSKPVETVPPLASPDKPQKK
ncbi:MAG: hypothetical protein ACAH88_02220 [Roseimicrobium sp.]